MDGRSFARLRLLLPDGVSNWGKIYSGNGQGFGVIGRNGYSGRSRSNSNRGGKHANRIPPQVNNRKGQKRRIRLVLFFVLCLFVWAYYTLYVQSEDLAGKKAELEALKQEMNAVQAEQAELTYKASRLYDQDYIAELARKQFFYTKPGESIYVIPE